jgi:hypothetical protein
MQALTFELSPGLAYHASKVVAEVGSEAVRMWGAVVVKRTSSLARFVRGTKVPVND